MPAEPTTADVREALALLGIERLVLAIHDSSFPADPDEDTGRGSPYTAAAHRFLAFAAGLGFDGLQLGPQGQTSLVNPSPYDGALFSREAMDVALQPLAEDPEWGGILSRDTLRRIVEETPAEGRTRVQHRYASGARGRALDEAFRAFAARPGLEDRREALAAWRRAEAGWLEPDALFEALSAEHGTDDWRRWSGPEGKVDQRLLAPPFGGEGRSRERAARVLARHEEAAARHAFVQHLLDLQHAELRRRAGRLGLRLYGDLQIGVSHRDRWARQHLFLPTYLMGAPPSRTNPEGQPWGYPVLDPDLYVDPNGEPGPAQRFMALRLDRMLSQFDGVRIDHPHGIVTPWVYKADAADPLRAVQAGARLFASPDLPDHRGLARYSICRPDQLDRTKPRYDDDWVAGLEEHQVTRFGVLLDLVVARARAQGREREDVLCEVLSTWPRPLRAVMSRHGLGRFYVTQKADPANPTDVYRSAHATPADWVMVGNHDTAPVWALAGEWQGTRREQWAEYLAGRLEPDPGRRAALRARVAASPAALAEALFADLFVGPARHVSVFFADLLGMADRYNVPGTTGEHNWCLRVPPDYEALYRERLGRGEALCPARALAQALRARGLDGSHRDLVGRLEGAPRPPGPGGAL